MKKGLFMAALSALLLTGCAGNKAETEFVTNQGTELVTPDANKLKINATNLHNKNNPNV